jgi:hypothetical protein
MTVTLVLLDLVLSGCEGFKELLTLQQELARTFQTPELRVNLNQSSKTLTVALVNSPLSADWVQEQATCRKVAEFVRDHYTRYTTLRVVQVSFASQVGAAGFSFTRSRTPCQFTHEELGEPAPQKVVSDSARPAA